MKKGFTLVEGIMLVIIVSMLGFSAYYVNSQNDETNQQVNVVDQSDSNTGPDSNGQAVENEIPEGFELIETVDYSFFWPTDWPEPETSTLAIDATIERRYNNDIYYDQDSNYWLTAVDGNPELNEFFERGDYDSFQPPIVRLERDLTVYNIGFGDAGCGYSVYTFASENNLHQIKTPVECGDMADVEDVLEAGEQIEELKKEIIFSIEVL